MTYYKGTNYIRYLNIYQTARTVDHCYCHLTVYFISLFRVVHTRPKNAAQYNLPQAVLYIVHCNAIVHVI
jgi:hypothetical protein